MKQKGWVEAQLEFHLNKKAKVFSTEVPNVGGSSEATVGKLGSTATDAPPVGFKTRATPANSARVRSAAPVTTATVDGKSVTVVPAAAPTAAPAAPARAEGGTDAHRVPVLQTPRCVSLCEKYRPASLYSVLGNDTAKFELRAWFESGSFSASPVLLYGPSGIGKTSLARAFLRDMKMIVQEVREFEVLNETVHTETRVLSRVRGVMIDEIHNFERADVQRITALIRVCKGKRLPLPPMICICDDPIDRSLESLRAVCRIIRMSTPACDVNNDVKLLIHRVISAEQLKVTAVELRQITQVARGDFRRALNTLEFLSLGPTLPTHPLKPAHIPRTGATTTSAVAARVATLTVPNTPPPDFLSFQSPFFIADVLLDAARTGWTATHVCDAVFNGAVPSSDWKLVTQLVHQNYASRVHAGVESGSRSGLSLIGSSDLERAAEYADLFSLVDVMNFHVNACSVSLFIRCTIRLSASGSGSGPVTANSRANSRANGTRTGPRGATAPSRFSRKLEFTPAMPKKKTFKDWNGRQRS